MRRRICPARTMRTSTATCRAPRPAATAVTRCPIGRPWRRAPAPGASPRACRWCATTPRAGPTPHAPGGCCAGWVTTRWRCSTAAWRHGAGGRRAVGRRRRSPAPRRPTRRTPAAMPTIDADALLAQLGQQGRACIVDARAAERFRGEVEPLDAGGRPHSRRAEPLLQGQPASRRPLQAGRAVARRTARRWGSMPVKRSSINAARASPRATTCWRWSMPGCTVGAVPGLVERVVRRPGAAGGRCG